MIPEQVDPSSPGQVRHYGYYRKVNYAHPYIGIDFDGTLAQETDPYREGEVGAPIWAMVKRVKQWIRDGKTVKIITARGDSAEDKAAIAYFLNKMGLPPLEITNIKQHGLTELWDDRAVAVGRNTGERLSPQVYSAMNRIFNTEPTIMEGETHASVVIVFSGSKIALVGRNDEPKFMLPAGHVDDGESAQEAASRELEEETGLQIPPDQLIFVGVYPRTESGENNSFFTAELEEREKIEGGSDVDTAFWSDIWSLPRLKFDPAPAMVKARKILASPANQRGTLVAFEGVDGSGKSTQVSMLADFLKAKGIAYSITRWNSSDYISDVIGDLKKERTLSPRLFFLLHAADMIHRYETEIMPALMRNEVVLCDRFYYTGLVRDSLRGVDRGYNAKLYDGVRTPDLLFYCKVDPALAVNRLPKDKLGHYSTGRDIGGFGDDKESSAIGYEREMDRLYGEVLPKEAVILDAAQNKEKVSAQVLAKVRKLIIDRYQIDDSVESEKTKPQLQPA